MTAALDSKTRAGAGKRREEFMRLIAGGGAIFPSSPHSIRNGDVRHEYRQDSDLYYLTAFAEPSAVAVLVPDHPEFRYVLFVQSKDPQQEIWTGWRAGEEGAVRDFGADAAFSIDKLAAELPKLLEKCDRIYYRFGIDPSFDLRIVDLMQHFRRERQRNGLGPRAIIDPADLLGSMRLVKNDEELQSLRRAIDITCEAHIEAMRSVGRAECGHEYEVEAALRHVFLRNGSHRPGYPPIVASGLNATVLHYTDNDQKLEQGDLLLIDAGAEFEYYTGDVTRTFPISGRFSKDQAQLYQAVLDAQLAAIKTIRPGVSFMEPHGKAVAVLTDRLLSLGLLEGSFEKLIEEESYKKFYMHRTSHWLGMDVHDSGAYKIGGEWRRLEPGMVLTIEPGLYVAKNAEGVADRYRGIGIRIEDDILVTENGCEVLSARAPKTIDEIEDLIAAR